MAESDAGSKMVASYEVTITNIERTKKEIAKLTGAITSLRNARYMEGTTMTSVVSVGNSDVLQAKIEGLEGRVQSGAQRATATAMANGRRWQTEALRAAVTNTGLSGVPKGRKGPGREVTDTLINAIKTNVETSKTADTTTIVGWHGWPDENRQRYFEAQEKGVSPFGEHPGVKAADSLGKVAIVVREDLKRELEKLVRP